MGLLLDTRSGRLLTLSARTLIGRSVACAVQLDDPRASGEHATIVWTGNGWEVRDLGSLNGTWVDGRRLASGEHAAIRCDTRLGFGGPHSWLLADDRPVGPAARNLETAELRHATSSLLALPSVDDPQATIFQRTDGQWMCELGAELRSVADRGQLEVAGACWLLFLPSELGRIPTTLQEGNTRLALAHISLDFAPSLDEEHVSVRVRTEHGSESLLPSRSSHYMLLTLARARMQDARNGVAPDEQGWLYGSQLATMLQYTAERLNLEIFRARSVFAKLGIVDATQLIERRTASRQLRLGIARVSVTRA